MTNFAQSAAITLIRLYVGALFVAHGAQKLFVSGPAATAAGFAHMGIPAPAVSAWLVIFAEFFCGLAMILGFLTRLVAIPIAIDMAGAILFVHAKNGFFGQKGGLEFPLMLLIACVAIVIGGPGLYAVDNVVFRGRGDELGSGYRRVA